MATTGVNFVVNSAAQLVGSANVAAGQVSAYDPAIVASGDLAGTVIDKRTSDLSTAGYAKNGAFVLNLTASTPLTVDLTNTAGVATGSAGSTAGDTSFATAKELIFHNPGSQDVIVGNAAAAQFAGPLGGGTQTFTVPAGSSARWKSIAGWACSVNKNVKFDPGAANATIYVAVGGA